MTDTPNETLVEFGERKRKEREELALAGLHKEVIQVMYLIDNATGDVIDVSYELTAHCIDRFRNESGILLQQTPNNKLKYYFTLPSF
jgi:hypothetical protein